VGRVAQGADGSQPVVPDRPNVLWILLDALRAQNLSCYGYDRETTPNLDELAARGVLFEHHLTQGLDTCKSVPSYMTGRYFAAACIGHFRWEWLMMDAAPGERLIPAVLGENGYHTFLISAHNMIASESRLGRAFDQTSFVLGSFGELNAAILETLDARPSGKPFFMYVHAMDTHFPHDPQPPHDRWLPEGVRGYDTPFAPEEQAYLRGLYDGSLAYADAQIGVLMRALEQRRLLNSTVIILSSDHGEMLGEDGSSLGHLYVACSEMLSVPLILAGPGLPEGLRVSAVTENVDIVPTLIDLLGLRTDAQPDGKTLLPLLGPWAGPHSREFWFCWKRDCPPSLAAFMVCHQGFLYDVQRGIPALFAWPCPLAQRRDVAAEHPEVVERIERHIRNDLVPRILALEERPRTVPAVFYARVPGDGHPADAYVSPQAESASDGKWTLDEGRLFAEAGERAPPLAVRFAVPNGHYRVLMEIGSTSPVTAVSCRAQGRGDWSTYAGLGQGPRFEFVDLGDLPVTDGSFRIEFKPGDPEGRATLVKQFKFTPHGLLGAVAVRSAREESDAAERLRALGYLD